MISNISYSKNSVFSQKKNSYQKIDTSDIKDNLKAIFKDAGEIIEGIKDDLKAENQKSLSAISNRLSSLLKGDAQASYDGNYDIAGVSFSKEEYTSATNLLKNTLNTLHDNNHDYSHYASYAIAMKTVESFTTANYQKEQAVMINNALSTQIATAENQTINYLDSFGEKKNDYYTSVTTLEKDSVSNTTDYASNQELIDKIISLFSSVNFSDQSDLENAIAEYQKLVTPAYSANKDETDIKLQNDKDYIEQNVKNFSATNNSEGISIEI